MPGTGDMCTLDNDVEDIEDMIRSSEVMSNERVAKTRVMPHVRKRMHTTEPIVADSVIPGTQTIYLKTWGCCHNSSDSEYMAGQLAAQGYTITDNKDIADLWLLNSCTVKGPAEDHFRNELESGQRAGKHVVVAGCVPQGQPKAGYIKGLSVIGVQQMDRVVEVVEETLKGNTVRLLGQKKANGRKIGGSSLSLPKIRRNPLIEIIAISTGCLNQCTYCKTKHARGELGSYPVEEIVARAKQSFKEGVVELWLTSEDTGAYGRDIGESLPGLLNEVIKTIPEGARLRLGMTNPPYILEHLEAMADILNHPQVYSFLHIPVQSASDSVLMDMKREYCIRDFTEIVDYLHQRVPDLTVATDIICGFPTETDQDFAETMELVKKYQFPSLFINQFFPRPGTPAAKMQRTIPTHEVKKRTKAVSELFRSYRTYDNKVGRIQQVLVTELSHDKQYYVAHNKSYDQVLVPKNDELLGRMVDVEIVEAGKHYLKSRLLDGGVIWRPIGVPPPLNQGQMSDSRQLSTKGEVNECSEVQSGHPLWVRMTVAIAFVAIMIRIVIRLIGS